jgi:hypothetical protein
MTRGLPKAGKARRVAGKESRSERVGFGEQRPDDHRIQANGGIRHLVFSFAALLPGPDGAKLLRRYPSSWVVPVSPTPRRASFPPSDQAQCLRPRAAAARHASSSSCFVFNVEGARLVFQAWMRTRARQRCHAYQSTPFEPQKVSGGPV